MRLKLLNDSLGIPLNCVKSLLDEVGVTAV